MAIKKIGLRVKKVLYEGIEVGVRSARVGEMEEVFKKRQSYIASINSEKAANIKNDTPDLPVEGNQAVLMEMQSLVAQMFACDPDDASIDWFCEAGKESEDKDSVKNVPYDLVQEIASCFFETGIYAKGYKPPVDDAAKKEGDVPAADPSKTGVETTSAIDGESALSPTNSESTPSESENGGVRILTAVPNT